MTSPPDLFDPAAIAAHRARARRLPDGPAWFLHDAVADEVEERLKDVNRSFQSGRIVTGWPEFWGERLGLATILDSETLALEPESLDLVIHAMSLHWANDPVGQLIQCRRALKPDGLFIAAFPGGATLHELRGAMTEAEARISGGLSPRVSPMGDLRDAGGLQQRAGLALPVADRIALTVTYETPFHLMRDLRAMGETNAMRERLKGSTSRRLMSEAAAIYQERHQMPDGRIPATFEITMLTGWAPDESQQKPLRPGSATLRLADALGTKELRPKSSD